MKTSKHAAYRFLRMCANTALKTSESLETWGKNLRDGTGELLSQVMTPAEREAYSLERYSSSAWEPDRGQSLPDWETQWFTDALPSPPARILLAGCGSGRELLHLIDRGFQVVAFDGAPEPVRISKHLAGSKAIVRRATFSDLVAAVSHKISPLTDVVVVPFDAVILGWGALTHAAGAQRRRQLLGACNAVTRGPILASFYFGKPPRQLPPTVRWGRQIAKVFRGSDGGPSLIQLSSWGGFAEYLSREEIAAHAASMGRDVEWFEGGGAMFPYVTFHPHP